MAEKPFELINLEKLDMAEKFSSIRLKLILGNWSSKMVREK